MHTNMSTLSMTRKRLAVTATAMMVMRAEPEKGSSTEGSFVATALSVVAAVCGVPVVAGVSVVTGVTVVPVVSVATGVSVVSGIVGAIVVRGGVSVVFGVGKMTISVMKGIQ